MSLPFASLAPRTILVIAAVLSVFVPAATASALPQGTPPELVTSATPQRTAPSLLEGAVLSGDAYIFVSATPQIADVFFYLDVSVFSGLIFQHEGHEPYDFAGTASGGVCREFDTTTIPDGFHQISAVVVMLDGTRVIRTSDFIVQNSGDGVFQFTPGQLDFGLQVGETASASVDLVTSTGAAVDFALTESAPWLTLSAISGTTPQAFDATVDSTGLADGVYQTTIEVTGAGLSPVSLAVELSVNTPITCSPLPCDEILVTLPYTLTFGEDHGGLLDAAGVGTGFTAIDAPDGASAYRPDLLNVDLATGLLELTSTEGIHYNLINDQVNTLGVGFDAASAPTVLRTRLMDPAPGTGALEQAGLWFGNDKDNYLKFGFASTSSGNFLHAVLELDGVAQLHTDDIPRDFTGVDVDLEIELDPALGTAFCYAALNGGARYFVAEYTLPAEFFSLGSALVAPEIGTASFGGVYGTHRLGPAAIVWSFDGFEIELAPVVGPPELVLSETTLDRELLPGEVNSTTLSLTTNTGVSVPYTLQETAPWLSLSQSAGTTPGDFNVNLDASGLTDGVYGTTVIASSLGLEDEVLAVELTVTSPVGGLDLSPDVVTFELAPGDTAAGTVSITTTGGGSTTFALLETADWLTLSATSGVASGPAPAQIELTADASGLGDGVYTATLEASAPGVPTESLQVELTVVTPPADFLLSPASVFASLNPDQTASSSVSLVTTTGSAVDFTLTETESWLSLSATSGTTPGAFDVLFDSTGLTEGIYQGSVEVTGLDVPTVFLAVELIVGDPTICGPLPCEDILVDLPYTLAFRQNVGGILDASGFGTGFTTIDAPDGSAAYQPELLHVDAATGVFELTTTRGIHYRSDNNQINTIGVGFDALSEPTVIRTRLLEPGIGTGRFEQGGLWFGIDDDNYIKFIVASTRSGSVIQGLMEIDGLAASQQSSAPMDLAGAEIDLDLELDPAAERAECWASLNGQPRILITAFSVPSEFFSADPLQVDPSIGTNSFAGVFGTHRYGPSPVVWRFEGFQVDLAGSASGPQLVLADDSVTFEIEPGQQDTASLDVSLDSGASVPFTLQAFEPWLSVTSATGTTPGSIDVDVDSTGLLDGVYSGTVIVLSPGVPSVEFEVELTVQSPVGELALDPTNLAFELEPGAAAASTVTITTTGGGLSPFHLVEDVDWLTLSTYSGTASGQSPASFDAMIDATGLADGVYTASVVASAPGLLDQTLSVELTVATPPDQLAFSTSDLFFLMAPDTQNTAVVTLTTNRSDTVDFTLTEAVSWLELSAISGTTPQTFDVSVDTTGLPDGVYETQVLAQAVGFDTQSLSVELTVDGPDAELSFDPLSLEFQLEPGEMEVRQVTVDTTLGGPVDYSLIENEPWLELSAPMGTTPYTVDVTVDATGLLTGVYQAEVTASADGFGPVSLLVQLTVGQPGACYPIACEEIMVDLPFSLDFSGDRGGILDMASVGTGFTTIEAPDGSASYRPELLEIDPLDGVLSITTTSGLHHRGSNSQINTLGVGIDAPNQVAIARTRLLEPDVGTGQFEQGGLWFGIDNDNYIKFVVASTRTGSYLHAVLEVDGVAVAQTSDVPRDFTGVDVDMEFVIDPGNERVTGFATITGQPRREIMRMQPPAKFFSFDAAGINPAIGTRSFVGIFGSHRNGPSPVIYRFQGFSIDVGETADSGGGLDFDRTSIPAQDPTNLAWGPDGRLYVTSLLGRVTAYTLDPLNQVVAEEVINSLTDEWGNRLTLGICIGPESTPEDVVLYVSHSNASLTAGQIDSAVVTRLSGAGFGTVENVITGLPRAVANHSINSIHFGPDQRLYITVGSNTGSGATNTDLTEFGNRPEQVLSAALLVADVFAVNFDGTCQNVTDPYGVPPCSVTPWATGLRNMYDFLFHSNGLVYGPNNGLGAVGTFPASAAAPCFGYADVRPVNQGGQNPGTQPDHLYLLEEGGYYGHPNPARDECVFGDGSLQGVPTPANYREPLFNMGEHRSPNGITEYPFDVGCVPLGGDLLVANYSVGDNLVRIVLAEDGRSVIADEVLATGFVNPIALVTNPAGTIFVAELGTDQVTALIPRSLGCWLPQAAMPQPENPAVVHPGSAELNGKLYVVGGRSAAGPVSTVSVFDPSTGSWTNAPDRPGAPLEGAAACALDGKLYVLGGATAGGAGASAAAHVFDEVAGTWTVLPSMGVARARGSAAAVAGKVYVTGGFDLSGASLASGEVFDPHVGSWSPMAPMSEARDSAGSFVVGSELFVVGGRTRAAGGGVIDGALLTMESFDVATGVWSSRASMPTARRSPMVGSLEGRFQVIAGEIELPMAQTVALVEEYDPGADSWRVLAPITSPRYGAAVATIGSRIWVAGGAADGPAASILPETLSFEF